MSGSDIPETMIRLVARAIDQPSLPYRYSIFQQGIGAIKASATQCSSTSGISQCLHPDSQEQFTSGTDGQLILWSLAFREETLETAVSETSDEFQVMFLSIADRADQRTIA